MSKVDQLVIYISRELLFDQGSVWFYVSLQSHSKVGMKPLKGAHFEANATCWVYVCPSDAENVLNCSHSLLCFLYVFINSFVPNFVFSLNSLDT